MCSKSLKVAACAYPPFLLRLHLLLGPGTNHRQAEAAPLHGGSHGLFKQAARGLSVRDSSDDLNAMSVSTDKTKASQIPS